MQMDPTQRPIGSPPAGDDGPVWRVSNRALARLLARHRPLLGTAVARAEAIGRGIDALQPLMLDLCRRTCRFCPEPCCITNTVWFDFKDLLFFHLQGIAISPRQAATECGVACPFLGGHGCRLDFRSRPWMCIHYLCPVQRSVLRKLGPSTERELLGNLATITDLRDRMEAEVVRQIRRSRSTA
jgi:hypothetical protein